MSRVDAHNFMSSTPKYFTVELDKLTSTLHLPLGHYNAVQDVLNEFNKGVPLNK